MKPIKFRGRDAETGKTVYGSLVEYATGQFKFWIHPPDDLRNHPVNEHSIAQLVGFDRDGNEIYEGDIIVGEYGNTGTACLVNNLSPSVRLKEAKS